LHLKFLTCKLHFFNGVRMLYSRAHRRRFSSDLQAKNAPTFARLLLGIFHFSTSNFWIQVTLTYRRGREKRISLCKDDKSKPIWKTHVMWERNQVASNGICLLPFNFAIYLSDSCELQWVASSAATHVTWVRSHAASTRPAQISAVNDVITDILTIPGMIKKSGSLHRCRWLLFVILFRRFKMRSQLL
jgi:hypothetical protein